MIRRRRPSREVAFSFDSFLDLVANVIGIILRFILVAWVGARAYRGDVPAVAPVVEEVAPQERIVYPEPEDPLADEIARQRRLLSEAQARLERQMDRIEQTRSRADLLRAGMLPLAQRREQVQSAEETLISTLDEAEEKRRALTASLLEVRERGRSLAAQIAALEKAPVQQKKLYYRTPISRPLLSEEVFFECRDGRVTVLDVGALLDQVRRDLPRLSDQLRTEWEVTRTTVPVGAFRLRYTLERDRDAVSQIAPQATPNRDASFRYGMSRWVAEPVLVPRGETVEMALSQGSSFREVMDRLDPRQAAVTFWVYPDSFPVYRRLRDDLHDRGFVVAGRPLPPDAPIAASRTGSASRGQ